MGGKGAAHRNFPPQQPSILLRVRSAEIQGEQEFDDSSPLKLQSSQGFHPTPGRKIPHPHRLLTFRKTSLSITIFLLPPPLAAALWSHLFPKVTHLSGLQPHSDPPPGSPPRWEQLRYPSSELAGQGSASQKPLIITANGNSTASIRSPV